MSNDKKPNSEPKIITREVVDAIEGAAAKMPSPSRAIEGIEKRLEAIETMTRRSDEYNKGVGERIDKFDGRLKAIEEELEGWRLSSAQVMEKLDDLREIEPSEHVMVRFPLDPSGEAGPFQVAKVVHDSITGKQLIMSDGRTLASRGMCRRIPIVDHDVAGPIIGVWYDRDKKTMVRDTIIGKRACPDGTGFMLVPKTKGVGMPHETACATNLGARELPVLE